METTMRDFAKFWDRVADGYAKRPVPDEAVYQRKLELTREYLTPQSRVLEFGCGTGSTAIAQAPFASSILATDISGRMLDIAREKAWNASASNVTFQQDSVETLSVPPESYDMVMAHSLLHLVEDPDAALRTMTRALKPGGVLVSSTICMGEGWLRVFKVIGPVLASLGFIPPLKSFTRDQLALKIARAGLAIDLEWFPEGGRAAFIIARKPG